MGHALPRRARENLQSRIPNPESRIPNPESRIPNPESPIPNPQSPIPPHALSSRGAPVPPFRCRFVD
ncbi:hypothetical protein EPA99_17310 [Pseudoxanthomonas composti]|uniref:Uncharacterized protein n=1 Tax=Pseudoxanthomonas composti TaxID=2137479 RepID=A0A4Q1JR57_9GAMM|nr:hypothetical protein EPA99_17310 [Pseudoxanthomonas composti]